MYRLVQVPLDGSSFAEHALPLAVSLAQRHEAALQVVHVHEPIAGVDFDRRASFEATLDSELMEHDQAYLDDIVERLREVTDICVSSALVKGPVADAIAHQAAAGGADLMVMTTHARGPLGRFWFGSVADGLVRQSLLPILIVRPQEAAADVSHKPLLRHVLIPLDGSALAEQALEPALALCGGPQTEYTLLRVVTPVIALRTDPKSRRVSGLNASLLRELEELHRRQQDAAADYLEDLARRLRARSLVVHSRVVLNDRVAAAVLEESLAIGADAIALTTRGQSGLKRLLLGSVADKLIRGATTPVLVCPPASLLFTG
jgi:nucleotide-binding universal stress UspA family protein